MLQLTPNSVIFVATIHVDFRKGIDGLIAICKLKLAINPFNGSIFLFYNKKKTTIKILAFDGQGFGFAQNVYPKIDSSLSYDLCLLVIKFVTEQCTYLFLTVIQLL